MTVPRWVATLPEADRSEVLREYEERAAIREFEGNQPRFRAEVEAWHDVFCWWEVAFESVRREREETDR